MRLIALLLTIAVAAPSAYAQQPPASSPQQPASASQDNRQKPDRTKDERKAADSKPTNDPDPKPTNDPQASDQGPAGVSLDKIKEALRQPPALSLRSLDETPTFRVQILERQRIEELLANLNFKSSPGPIGGYTPGGGLYGFEQQRQMFPAVDNPLRQPYAAFSQGELLVILIENLVGKYLGGRAIDAVTSAERARAEAAAKEEVRSAVTQYCAAQPNGGAGIQICGTTIR